MKIVREHINEKFSEESDPIRDLGIGAKVDINKEWEDLNEEFDNGNEGDDIYVAWKHRLEQIFLGRKATGNFAQGNSSSYGAVQHHITTKTPIVRIEIEGDNDFSLVCIVKDSWDNPEGSGDWVDPDEIWYVVELDENKGRKILLSQ
jgi:hypothetical protein